MSVVNCISLLGGIAMFLYGVTLMGNGLNVAAGNKLELVLYRLTDSPLKGIALGTGVTALIQSSTATSAMAVGFVNSGMMRIGQAVPIILGSILGTSVTGWIICLSELGQGGGWVQLLSAAAITGVVAAAGIILRKFCRNKVYNQIGTILLGFAVLMYGMSAMSAAVTPLRESEAFLRFITAFTNPLPGLLAGAVFTAIIQSSSAAVGVLQALAVTGALTFAETYPILLGVAVGSAIPVLLSALGAKADGRRTALTHLLIDVLGALGCGVILYAVNAVHPLSVMERSMSMVGVAALNTVFRLAVVVLLLPLLRRIEALACRIVKDDPVVKVDMGDMDRLEERFLQHPALAIEQSRIVICSMAEAARKNLNDSINALTGYSDELFREIEETEALVDRYEDRLGTYLVRLSGSELARKQNDELYKYLHSITDLERISDHALNIGECAKELHDKGIHFSGAAEQELGVLRAAVTEVVDVASAALRDNDLERARLVEPLEQRIDDLCDELKGRHVDRLQRGLCTLQNGFVFNDLLTNFERVGDHCSNIAVAMIELARDEFETHQYLDTLEKENDPQFTRCYEMYREKYHLEAYVPQR